jgi:hypothetical protein
MSLGPVFEIAPYREPRGPGCQVLRIRSSPGRGRTTIRPAVPAQTAATAAANRDPIEPASSIR